MPKAVDLRKVVKVLQLSKSEEAELVRLASARRSPDNEFPSIRSDSDGNLLLALLEVEHDWPSEPRAPTPNSARARVLIDAAGWALAEVAAKRTDILPPFSAIRWPDRLQQLGVVPAPPLRDGVIEPPEELIRQELPYVDVLADPITPMDAHSQSIGMARVYRRLLFSDLDRAREVLATVERWEYDRSQPLSDSVSLIFRERGIHEAHGCRDVKEDAVSNGSLFNLALHLWRDGQTRGDSRVDWHCDYEPFAAISLVSLPHDLHPMESYACSDFIRAAIYLIRSPMWPYAAQAICRHRGIDPQEFDDLAKQVRIGVLNDKIRERVASNSVAFAAVEQKALLWFVRSLEARVPPPDTGDLWRPGDPLPDGHWGLGKEHAHHFPKAGKKPAAAKAKAKEKVKRTAKKAKRKTKKKR